MFHTTTPILSTVICKCPRLQIRPRNDLFGSCREVPPTVLELTHYQQRESWRKKRDKIFGTGPSPKAARVLKNRPIAIKPQAVFSTFDRFNDPHFLASKTQYFRGQSFFIKFFFIFPTFLKQARLHGVVESWVFLSRDSGKIAPK